VAIGQVYRSIGNDAKALPYLRKGLEIGSQYLSSAYANLARSYINLGDYGRAEQYLGESIELEVSCYAIGMYSWLLTVQGKFQQALQFTDSICQQGQCGQVCSRMLFNISLLLGEYEKAEHYFYQWQNAGSDGRRFNRHIMNCGIGYVYYQLGKTEEADKIFAEQIEILESVPDLERRGVFRYSRNSLLPLSRIYAFMGDKKQALKYLAECAKNGFILGWHDYLLIDPFFERLWDDPEFKSIMKQAQDEKDALRAQVREMEERGELDL